MILIKILAYILYKIAYVFTILWVILAMIPLFIGGIMIDILLRLLGVESTFLMMTDILRWFETLGVYLKTNKKQNNNEFSGEE